MSKPRFVNVYVWREAGELCSGALHDFGSRLDADVAAIGFRRATAMEPRLGRYLREAGVAFKVKVTMKEAVETDAERWDRIEREAIAMIETAEFDKVRSGHRRLLMVKAARIKALSL